MKSIDYKLCMLPIICKLSADTGRGCCFLQLLLKGSAKQGFKKIRVHILTDGRDVLDGTSFKYVQMLEDTLRELREERVDAKIASGGGRMKVTMDRYEVSKEDPELESLSNTIVCIVVRNLTFDTIE